MTMYVGEASSLLKMISISTCIMNIFGYISRSINKISSYIISEGFSKSKITDCSTFQISLNIHMIIIFVLIFHVCDSFAVLGPLTFAGEFIWI